MIWLILATFITYLRALFNNFISDDITLCTELRKKNFPINIQNFKINPFGVINDTVWKLLKDKPLLHHLFSMALYIGLNVSFYIVIQKFIPENVAFLATLIFIVHPCNAQIAGWISGRWYILTLILGLWAIYFNNIVFYLLASFTYPTILLLPLIMKIPLWLALVSIWISLYLFSLDSLGNKIKQTQSEGVYKKDNMKLYPRKLIVALKSYCYYFILAMFPLKMGWFHEIGEPLDDKIKSFNFHTILCCLFISVLFLFIGKPVFLGIFLFTLLIIPFINIVSPALFTSERYISASLLGYSIFLAYLIVDYPIIATVIITAYFMRTQLELIFYRDDFNLALYSLINFTKSGFAWSNFANFFLHTGRPAAAYDILQEATRQIPDFPTTYYQLYLMYRSVDLLHDYDKALIHLEKACHYGYHEGWYKELEDFKDKLKQSRIRKFKDNVARHTESNRFRPTTQRVTQELSEVCVGAA